MPVTLSSKLLRFYPALSISAKLPATVEVLKPHNNKDVAAIMKTFYQRFFNDNNPRRLLLGINPGRFGAGITGLNFTAPRQLREYCGIDHPFGHKSELSAEFIYEVIEQYGGPAKFYTKHFISSVCPLGFTKAGVNLNYYDDKQLQAAIIPFVVDTINKQLGYGFLTDRCICIGGEKNYKFLRKLNDEHHFFNEIIPLPHPRFILQYRRKQKQQYIDQYLSALQS